ncbi:Aldehyde dehydrogenase [hydrothermal vent metagenome]|uniref:Aldehyde dehydrogenase n=1 Tax=hydrothermal vent metagenome TaxID=652676 RepID=A0A1W1D245_9ZZZZ
MSLKEFDEINALRTAERKGYQKGETNKSIEIAKNLLDVLDDETIALKTGLSVESIKKLRIE